MSSVVKITKGLAAIGTEERERALVDVQLWVENTKFEKMDAKKIESDFLRIWQGIFYCTYTIILSRSFLFDQKERKN